MAMPAPPVVPRPAGPTGMATAAPKNEGLEARAPIAVQTAMKHLAEALKVLDPMSKEAQIIHKASSMLIAEFGSPSPDLTKADLKMNQDKVPSVTPADPARFQSMMRQNVQNMLGQPAPALAPASPVMSGA